MCAEPNEEKTRRQTGGQAQALERLRGDSVGSVRWRTQWAEAQTLPETGAHTAAGRCGPPFEAAGTAAVTLHGSALPFHLYRGRSSLRASAFEPARQARDLQWPGSTHPATAKPQTASAAHTSPQKSPFRRAAQGLLSSSPPKISMLTAHRQAHQEPSEARRFFSHRGVSMLDARS